MTPTKLISTLAIAGLMMGLTTKTPAQQMDTLPDPTLIAKWSSLTAYLIEEFRIDHRSAIGNIEGDFSTLEIKLRVTPDREDGWVQRTFTERELRRGDLRAVAKTLYELAKRAAPKYGGPSGA